MFGLSRKPQRLVMVNFQEIESVLSRGPNLKPGHGYTYKWNLKEEPAVGLLVFVEGINELSTAVLCDANAPVPNGYRVSELKPVRRLVTQKEIDKVRAQIQAGYSEWEKMFRKAAGFPVQGRVRRTPPAGFQDVPPLPNRADAENAGRHGRGWWKIYKYSVERGAPQAEVATFKQIANDWFEIRDRFEA